MNTYSKSVKVWMILIALITWYAVVLQLYIMIDNTPGNGLTPWGAVDRFMAFFTIWTNILVAVCLTMILVFPSSGAGKFFSRPSTQTAITLYILVVGIAYNILLRGLIQLGGRDSLVNELLHVVVPVLFIVYWIFFVTKGTLKWRNLFPWMIYPAVYLTYALLRGHGSGFYPYPFLNVAKFGYHQVAINSAGLMLVFIVAGLLLIALDRSSVLRRRSQ
jgi:hypothetical protein